MKYLWKDNNTQTEVEVDRTMAEYDIPPDKEEALQAGMEIEEFAHADWVKVVTGGVGTIGFGQKGNW